MNLMNRLRNPRFRYAAVLSTAAALAAVLIGASQVSADDARTVANPADNQPAVPAGPEPSLFAGIEQRGAALGSAKAPVTLVEYADLQCPYCARWALNTLPTLVEKYVRSGKLRIVFSGMAFIGPDSDKALRTVVAAGKEGHLWDVLHGLYLHQGHENAGWVTDELVAQVVAAGIPSLEVGSLLGARWNSTVTSELTRAAQAAQAAGVRGTPAFQIGPTGGRLELVHVSSLTPEGIVPAIEKVLVR